MENLLDFSEFVNDFRTKSFYTLIVAIKDYKSI